MIMKKNLFSLLTIICALTLGACSGSESSPISSPNSEENSVNSITTSIIPSQEITLPSENIPSISSVNSEVQPSESSSEEIISIIESIEPSIEESFEPISVENEEVIKKDIENQIELLCVDKVNTMLDEEAVKSFDFEYVTLVDDYSFGKVLELIGTVSLFRKDQTTSALLGFPLTNEEYKLLDDLMINYPTKQGELYNTYDKISLQTILELLNQEKGFRFATKKGEMWDLESLSATKYMSMIQEESKNIMNHKFISDGSTLVVKGIYYNTISFNERTDFGKCVVFSGNINFTSSNDLSVDVTVSFELYYQVSDTDYENLFYFIPSIERVDENLDLADNYEQKYLKYTYENIHHDTSEPVYCKLNGAGLTFRD